MKRVLITFGLCMLVSSVAFAGANSDARVALHAKSHAAKAINICPSGSVPEDPNSNNIPCRDFVTEWPTFTSADVYLVAGFGSVGDGLAGLSCGIQYDANVGMFGWTLCANLDFPNGGWPVTGGGNRITWDSATNCQQTDIGGDGAQAVAGAFYVYAYGDGLLEITTNNNVPVPELKVADCSAAEEDLVLLAASKVGFGTVLGYNSCDATPVEQTTWGTLKSLFEQK